MPVGPGALHDVRQGLCHQGAADEHIAGGVVHGGGNRFAAAEGREDRQVPPLKAAGLLLDDRHPRGVAQLVGEGPDPGVLHLLQLEQPYPVQGLLDDLVHVAAQHGPRGQHRAVGNGRRCGGNPVQGAVHQHQPGPVGQHFLRDLPDAGIGAGTGQLHVAGADDPGDKDTPQRGAVIRDLQQLQPGLRTVEETLGRCQQGPRFCINRGLVRAGHHVDPLPVPTDGGKTQPQGMLGGLGDQFVQGHRLAGILGHADDGNDAVAVRNQFQQVHGLLQFLR